MTELHVAKTCTKACCWRRGKWKVKADGAHDGVKQRAAVCVFAAISVSVVFLYKVFDAAIPESMRLTERCANATNFLTIYMVSMPPFRKA